MRTSRFFAYRLIKTSENILDKVLGAVFCAVTHEMQFFRRSYS